MRRLQKARGEQPGQTLTRAALVSRAGGHTVAGRTRGVGMRGLAVAREDQRQTCHFVTYWLRDARMDMFILHIIMYNYIILSS